LAACSPTSTTAALGDADPDYAPGWNGVAVEGTPAMPEAEFVGEDGEPFDLAAEMRERPTLLYFGYTHCPDICPVHMVNIAQALDKSRVRTDEINVVFVTADPARDTPSVLSDYMDNFDTTFDGLWAPQHVVNDVVTDLGLPEPVIERDPDADADNYTVGHPGQVLAFDTDGRAQISYPFGTRQSQWAEDLPKIVREDWS
jgi:protein SCO1/2